MIRTHLPGLLQRLSPRALISPQWMLVVGLSLGSAGCGSLVADRCDTVCDCENCGDREREACEIEADGLYAVADTYSCVDALEIYLECQLQEHECEDRRYRDDNDACQREANEYAECKEAFSTREPGPY